MATLMERFEEFQQLNDESLWSFKEFAEELAARFKPSEGLQYCLWNVERARQARVEFRTPTMSRDELLYTLDTMNYNDKSSRAKLLTAMYREISPWIPVGRDENGDFYRIVLNPDALLADQDSPPGSHELVSRNVLGVNTNVQPSAPAYERVDNMPNKSTRLNESDDSDNGGFVFHQIGNVEIWCDEQEHLRTLEDAGNGPWFTTTYAAVVKVNNSGASEGIYIIFDFYEPDEATQNRLPRYNGSYWGYFGDMTMQFSFAKIADKISELDLFRSFHLTEIIPHPVEIVRVGTSPQGSMVRVTIAE